MKKRILILLLVLYATIVSAQERVITGTVTDANDRLPIPGVSVRERGTQNGASTTGDGRYSLRVSSPTAVLEFSYIGYTTQAIPLSASNVINVALGASNSILNEVVVTANAIRREKRTLGYSAPTLNNEELNQGENPSNTPGSSSRVVLRGGSSISGNNQALIVVDGVPIDNSSVIGGGGLSAVDFGNRGNDINPDDVESVTVLKGPGATALYGSRASNGALIITTKRGKKGAEKMEITFSSANSFSSILKLPDLQNEYGQGYFVDFDASGNPIYENDPKENFSYGAPFNGQVQPWGQQIDEVRLEKPYVAIENNVRDFFDTGFVTDNNLGFREVVKKPVFIWV
jgi:TonB-dependent SusC/RagA subfamily outer membrane receptor